MKELLWVEYEYPQTPKELRSAIFLIAIVVPTLTVWTYLYP
jgi:hypothetical protein